MFFNEYVNNLRIDHAKVLLAAKESETIMSEVASMCGYASEASFYRNFKARTGVTLTVWITTHRGRI